MQPENSAVVQVTTPLHKILFTRTLRRDYRWLWVPEYLQENDRELIFRCAWVESLRRSYFGRAAQPSKLLAPTFLIATPNAYVLVRFRRTKATDMNGRAIDSIEGVAVQPANAWQIRLEIKTLLSGHPDRLDHTNTLDWDAADNPRWNVESPLLVLPGSKAQSNLLAGTIFEPPTEWMQLRFDRESYNAFIASLFLRGRQLSLLQFAFGADEQIMNTLRELGANLIVPASGSPEISPHLKIPWLAQAAFPASAAPSKRKPATGTKPRRKYKIATETSLTDLPDDDVADIEDSTHT